MMPRTTTERFYWNVPDDILSITHGGRMPQALSPPGITSLAGTPIESMVGVMIRLRNEAGELIGIGSELETFPSDGGPLRVTYTFKIAERGSFAVYEDKKYEAPDLDSAFAEVQSTGKTWEGELPVVSTCGPAENGLGVVFGGSGEFAGVTGTMFQTMNFRRIPAEGSAIVHNTETINFVWPD